MTANHGKIHDEDVAERVCRPVGTSWQIVLHHYPTRTAVSAVERTELLARQKAWLMLRDELEGLTGGQDT